MFDVFDPAARTFATLSESERGRASAALRPLPWIDGLAAAIVISPSDIEPTNWLKHAWREGERRKLGPADASELDAMITGHFEQVLGAIFENPEAYRPFLGDEDPSVAAPQWAAGFRFGIRLEPEPWAPLIDADASRFALAAIFSLEREEDMSEADRANHPLRNLPEARRKELAANAIGLLPSVVRALHEFSIRLDASSDRQSSMRSAPKVGRNHPCPCGSGKKYKKCCLNAVE